ncbi:CDK5 regulatory subunit-associated protein 3-like [Clytia hemisphaerica]
MVRGEDLPIDIYYNKLLDWLIDRRHCEKNWQDNAGNIREKINTAIQDMPPNQEITDLLSGTYINYFHCNKIVSLLKQCGEGSTNFFGQYSSKRMKDWQEIINNYKDESVFLAEAAQMIMRNVNYEIPGLKRQIAKCQLTQRECQRKEKDCNQNSALFKAKYLKLCKQMGIPGSNVRKELVELAQELPGILKDVSEETKSMEDACQYYSAFIKFVNQKDTIEEVDITPLIKFVIEHGNATVYQWKTGNAPSKIEESIQKVDMEAMAKISVDGAGDEEAEIDWGYLGGDTSTTDGGIDFGDEGDLNADGDGGDIDWGNMGDGVEDIAITVEDAGQENPEGGVASGDEALSVLENTTTRNVFIDELLELQSFLEQRLSEMRLNADMITVYEFQSAPALLQIQTIETLQSMLGNVTSVLQSLTSVKMQNLYLIKSSPRYVDRISESMEQKLRVSEKLLSQITSLRERSQEAVKTQGDTEPKLALIVKKTKELQSQVESEISSRYKDRKVNIMGEINTI